MKGHPMPFSAIIFDVDGTLAETEEVHRSAFNETFARHGFEWSWSRELYGELLKVTGGKERMRHYLQTTHPAVLDRPDIDGMIKALHEEKTALYQTMMSEGRVPLRPGIARLLHEAKDAPGIKLAISTTTSNGNVEALLIPALGADVIDWFNALATGEDVTAKKPAPDLYLYALSQLGLPPQECLAIEDSVVGLRSATAAGIPTLVTVSAYTRDNEYPGALAVLSDLGEPDRPFELIAGDAGGCAHVDLSCLEKIHAKAGRG
ncbi:MAG: HAD family hydrolase [Rhodospirillales bacterium]|nr:HAD family hydrolase [Rhodospirillales bacterium]